MKLYVIGNGFDRAHKLPTSYWDFRTYIAFRDPEFLRSFESHYDIYPATKCARRRLLWNELESNLANIDEEAIIGQITDIDMGLDSGDTGISDTLYSHFSADYDYINQLAKYLKQWVRTIRIRDIKPRTSHIKTVGDDFDITNNFYITFNYTAVLETIYNVNPLNIVHIHGSLRQRDGDPILGHGNKNRIDKINDSRNEADNISDEKWSSACSVVRDYYMRTYKDISKYMYQLGQFSKKPIDEIIVAGHSLAGVDQPYFSAIDNHLCNRANWKVYYFEDAEKNTMRENLMKCGIDENRIEMLQTALFYDIETSTDQEPSQSIRSVRTPPQGT